MGICLSRAEDAVNDFIDSQSRFYKESKQAKEHLEKKKSAGAPVENPHITAVFESELSPIYPSLPKAAKRFHCHHVYDGDTLTLDGGDRVRLLGIDTPELKEKQPFALEAKEYTKRYCHGKDIWLSFDENAAGEKNGDNKDHYGRLLAFIWVSLENNGGKQKQNSKNSSYQWLCINEGIIASGLACAYSPKKTKKVHNYDKLMGLQKLARVHKLGMWKNFKDYDTVVTPNGSAFHKCNKNNGSDCKHLARSKNLSAIKASVAYDRGLHPCRNCLG
ncbi:hypothetical protein ACHAXS_006317 [Conticribra weissflogii]